MSDSLRAVIYARYSTELQNEKSIEDQLAPCRADANREGYKVVDEFHDAAKSGASMFRREGLQDLLAIACARKYDAVIVEALDRLSSNMEDVAGIHKRLSFAHIKILAIHDGGQPAPSWSA